MKIPKTVKIGGKVYGVEITDKFDLGSANVSAEISYVDLAIRVSPIRHRVKWRPILSMSLSTVSMISSVTKTMMKSALTNWHRLFTW